MIFAKKFIFCAAAFAIAASLAGCSRSGKVVFCEGTNADNKPVKAGKVFEDGWITLYGEFPDAFKSDSVTVKIYDTEDGDILPEDTQSIKVKPEDKSFRTDFLLLNESTYKAVIELPGNKQIGEATVKIIESF